MLKLAKRTAERVLGLRIIEKSMLNCRGLSIINYHRVYRGCRNDEPLDRNLLSAEVDSFRAQMEFLAKRCNVIGFEQYLSYCRAGGGLPRNSVIVTFDDGYRDNYELAFPVLKGLGLKATIFLTTGHIGTKMPFWWDKVAYMVRNTKADGFMGVRFSNDRERAILELDALLKRVGNEKKKEIISRMERELGVSCPETDCIMGWAEIREMAKHGISFGAHTVSHPILSRLSLKDAEAEISESKRRIEQETGQRVIAFAYPNGMEGDFNSDTIRILKRHGFRVAVTGEFGINTCTTNPFRLKRKGVEYDDGLGMFALKLAIQNGWMARLYRRLG